MALSERYRRGMTLCLLVGGWLSLMACHPPTPRVERVVSSVAVAPLPSETDGMSRASYHRLTDRLS
ncbi:exported protein of unknown function [Candidatus Nitrospira inopinata]|uniref:Uncharacterized protein n=1 Tax=Candidatus Nitrospira inopinata TaxID=1715989 RepID=A0A0S4KRF7_9BACT|nr:exported protein of unknown function [Candidatus Nitrospira inopinata]